MNWINKLRRKATKQKYYLHCEMLGVSDLESALILKIARYYPFSALELLDVYIASGRSYDITIQAIEDSLEKDQPPVLTANNIVMDK